MTPATAAAFDTALMDVPVTVEIVMGEVTLPVETLRRMQPEDVLQLDRDTGGGVDIYVSGRLMARGELMVVEGELGVTLTEIVDAPLAA